MGIRAELDAAFGTRFLVTVDTEEEFAWGAPLSRDRHDTQSVSALRDGQNYFSRAGVAPIYFCDAPVVNCATGREILAQFVADEVADIGAHLHPWVTPPFEERVNSHNSYAGNLPEALERAKICHIRDLITAQTGKQPIVYRAGRYGIGPNTYRILQEEGFLCDSSIRPLFDYRRDGGPDFRFHGQFPTFEGPDDSIIELPLTTVFTGSLAHRGASLFAALRHTDTAKTLLARLGLLQRVPLTPEGVPAKDACYAIDEAVNAGIRLLVFSFHSPSLAPGNTPYVRNTADLAAFYQWFDRVFDHCSAKGIQPARLGDILSATAR